MATFLNNNSGSNVTKGNFEQALGFVNVTLPNSSGKHVQFASAPLKASNAAEKGMFDDLSSSPDMEAQILAWILANIQVNFKVNNSGEKAITFGYKKAA